ncbi:protein FAM47E isoform X3 [Delphinus delphis]|uniref:protein FAM47E isoform X3 n=1 Tax=Delphinus delphis TaxID=9728 RepID=UPI0028C3F7AF|nr:protein FAM47E isoform X3 [Delphinus delphis]
MLPREAALCSTLSPARQARKDFLADVEAHPTPHPSAPYPDLEEDMPAEVLEVLGPDRKLEDTRGYCQGIRKRMKEPTKLLKKRSTQVFLGHPKKTPVSHPGQWLYEEKKPSESDLLCNDGPLRHENVRKGVSDFCSWATKFNPYKPKWVKMRYGAWYLNTKLWKKQRADEPLVDPKVLHKAQDENMKKELWEQEELLADLHGTAAFKDFILRRGYRMPSVSKGPERPQKDLLRGSQLLMGRGQHPDKIKILLLQGHTRTQPWEKGCAFPRRGPTDGLWRPALFRSRQEPVWLLLSPC